MKNATSQKIAVIFLVLIGLFLASAVFAEEEKSILDRVKIVDDPELAELIRIATNNLPQARRLANEQDEEKRLQLQYEAEIAKAKAIRIVTETYAQIKLLDEKIKQINIKYDESKTTRDIAREVLLAKSDLEAQRLTKIAELRESMNWTPWTPFGSRDYRDINTFITLEVIDNTIRILLGTTISFDNNLNAFSLYSPEDTIKYLADIFKRPDARPVRIAIYATNQGTALANELRERIILIAKNAKAEFQTDLAYKTRTLTVEHSSILVWGEKQIRFEDTDYDNTVKSFADYIKKRLQMPGALPRIYQITYKDANLKDKAKELEDALNAVIKELGYTKYVQVENKGQSVDK